MSFTLVARLWEYKFTASERAILGAMVDHADEAGGSIRPSIARVAWKTDYSERQVQRCVHALTERGVLVIVHPAAGRRPTEYRLNLDAAERKPAFNPRGDVVSPRQDDTPDNVSPLRVRSSDTTSPQSDPEPIRGDIDDAVGVTLTTSRGDMVAPEPTREQTIKNRENPPVPNGTSPTPKYTRDFMSWWNACPARMRRCGKGETFGAWNKANGSRPPLPELLRVLAFQAASYDWTKEGGQYIPMATTYLNRGRWEADESAFSRDGPNGNGTGKIAQNQANLQEEAAEDGIDFRGIFQSNGHADAGLPGRTIQGSGRALPERARGPE